MHYIKQHRWVRYVIAIILVLAAITIWQFVTLQKAHSSFANYAAFRGCAEITGQSATSGTCTLANGQPITMVQVNGRWYLQGDLGWLQ